MNQVEVTNMPPVWVFYAIGIAQIVFGLAIAAIAVVLLKLVGTITEILADVKQSVPNITRNADATLANVKAISDDARVTAHNVTGTVNRVSHVVGAVTGKLESPLVKSIGVLSGVAAGINTIRGAKKTDVSEKRRGFLGRKK